VFDNALAFFLRCRPLFSLLTRYGVMVLVFLADFDSTLIGFMMATLGYLPGLPAGFAGYRIGMVLIFLRIWEWATPMGLSYS
jgi:hypothetical protein